MILKQIYRATTRCCVQKHEFSLKLLSPVQRETEFTAGPAGTGHFKVKARILLYRPGLY